jgi:hypothetical protein
VSELFRSIWILIVEGFGCLKVNHFLRYDFELLSDFGSGMCLELVLHNCGTLLGSILALFDTLLLHLGIQNHPWGCPAKVSKASLEKHSKEHRTPQANASKMAPEIAKVGGIFYDMFEAFPASFCV